MYAEHSSSPYPYAESDNIPYGCNDTEYEGTEEDYDSYESENYDDGFNEESYHDDKCPSSDKHNKADDLATEPTSVNTQDTGESSRQEPNVKIYKHSPRGNDGSSGKDKEVIMLDSTWWFSRMAENLIMSESEEIFVDAMVSFMKLFYFPSLKKRLDKNSLSENLISDLKKIYEDLSELFG